MESTESLGQKWWLLFTSLADGTRRQLIGSLLEAPYKDSLSLPDAANMPTSRLDPDVLYADLVHTHLPMMEQEGFIEWDHIPSQVSRGPNFEDVATVLMTIAASERLPSHLTEGCHFREQILVNP